MMRLLTRISLVYLMAGGAAAWGAQAGQDPYIGYVYPAGGQRETVFQVTVGGQRLSSARNAYVSGKGVRASVVRYQGASGPLSSAQQEELKRRLQEIRDARKGVQPVDKPALKKPKKSLAGSESSPDGAKAPAVTLPDLPELRNLEQMTGPQLMRVAEKFLNRSKRPKPPIAEEVTLEVTMDPDAAPGDRELRLRTPSGLTNPLVFQVGQVPETREPDTEEEDVGTPPPAQPPIVLNGQIMPGEVDRFPLQLQGGQRLVIAAQARKLIPYLADAVPGWFQAIVALYDANGKELAFDDDCGFDPDPAFVFRVPHNGEYTLEIRDALYRGREDFVYRVDIGEESLIKSLFPLGSRGGVPIGAARADRKQYSKLVQAHFQSADKPLPECDETEPNNTGQKAMRMTLPHVISGSIAAPGDTDMFRFEGRTGDQVVAEVYARRMGSPLDSLLRLLDASGRVVASNDDHKDMEAGLLTHQADSYLSARLPAAGHYSLQISDAQRHGGPEFSYYLRIGPPQPDFALRLTPSSLNVPAGRAVTATVYALRKDGWDGDIEVALKDAPAGFALSGGRIPKGRDQVRMTLIAPPRGRTPRLPPFAGGAEGGCVVHLEGRAQIGGKTVTRPVTPADNVMQAFAYQHLVPSEELMVMVRGGGRVSPSLDIANGDRLRIPAGGSVQLTCSMHAPTPNIPVRLELSEPPAGVTLQDVTVAPDGFTFVLKADDKHTGYADNLIIEVFTEQDAKSKKGAVAQKQRVSLGILPAVPFEIVKP